MYDVYEYAVNKHYLGEKEFDYQEMWEVFRGKVMVNEKYNGEPIFHYDTFMNRKLRDFYTFQLSDICRKGFRTSMGLLKTQNERYEEYDCEYHRFVASQVEMLSERFENTYDLFFGHYFEIDPEEEEMINQLQIEENETGTTETTDGL